MQPSTRTPHPEKSLLGEELSRGTRGWRAVAGALVLALAAVLCAGSPAWGHGSSSDEFRSTILSVEPKGLPVDVRISGGDQIRFENQGDEELVICGYERETCEEWVRISPKGVYVDENSKSFYANVESTDYGEVPQDAGTKADWVRVRSGPPFYSYHDHRVHWMGTGTPPGVDTGNASPQKVFEAEVRFRYGDTDGVVRTRLEYVGGKTWLARHGEQLLVWGGVLVMLVVFLLDWRKRRRAARAGDDASAPAKDAA